MSGVGSELCGYTTLPEPDLVFAGNKTHKHPLTGLIENGPYGQRFGTPSRLRLAILAPQRDLTRLKNLVAELGRRAQPKEAKNYYPEYPGFEQLFRIPVAPLDDRLVISFPDELDRYAGAGSKHDLARALFQCIAQLGSLRGSFDAAQLCGR